MTRRQTHDLSRNVPYSQVCGCGTATGRVAPAMNSIRSQERKQRPLRRRVAAALTPRVWRRAF